ncbi:hypothetical protein JCM10213_006817 [Rhodosporidiobolus nylandii]
MSTANSTVSLSLLPHPPPDANPFAYWYYIAHHSIYRTPESTGAFEARLVVLTVLLGYLVAVALAGLILTVVDSRRRKKPLFLWRLVRRQQGKYIVGSQQLLEPILTIIAAAIYIAHVVVEWRWVFGTGSYAIVAPLRLATWAALFVQIWIVSWASLQSFVITAGEGRSLRWFTPVLANSLFVLLGLAVVVVLLLGVGYAGIITRDLWHAYTTLRPLLLASIPIYPTTVNDATAALIAHHWQSFYEEAEETLYGMQIAVVTFAASASVTFLSNLGGIALLMMVRRQIKSNYSNFVASSTHAEVQLPTLNSTSAPRVSKFCDVEVEVDDLHSGSQGSGLSHDPQPVAGVAFSVTPPTPQVLQTERYSSQASPQDGLASRKTSLGSERTKGESGVFREHKKRRAPSRSAVRKIAEKEAGGVAAAQARNLQLLHRAESDLFITCCSSMATAVSFIVLSAWCYVALPKSFTLSWGEVEGAVFAGSWIFAGIHSLALTAHLYTSWQNLYKPVSRSSILATSRSVHSSRAGISSRPSAPVTPFDHAFREGDYFGAGSRRTPARADLDDPSWLQTHSLGSALRLGQPAPSASMGLSHSLVSAVELDSAARLREERLIEQEEVRQDPTWLSPDAAALQARMRWEEDEKEEKGGVPKGKELDCEETKLYPRS